MGTERTVEILLLRGQLRRASDEITRAELQRQLDAVLARLEHERAQALAARRDRLHPTNGSATHPLYRLPGRTG